MNAPDPEQGTYRGLPAADDRGRWRWSRGATAWVAAAALLLVIAGLGGLAAAYLVSNMRAVPPPDAAFVPTPTASLAATPSAVVSASPSPAPTSNPTTSPLPSGPTPEPTPEPTPFEYEVQSGDSVTRIALRFGVTPESIIELNDLRNPNRILPGQVLLIPGAPNVSPSPSP